MKSLTYRKFNHVHKTVLLSSLLISPMALAKPIKNKDYHANPTLKLQRAEIKNLKSQISQIQKQNQQKIEGLMARLSKLEKLTEQEEKKLAERKVSQKKTSKLSSTKAKSKSTEKSTPNKTKKQEVKKTNTNKNSKKTLEKTATKKKKDTKTNKQKNGKKVLGADEISVEQLDLAKLSAGAKIETIHKPIQEENTTTANAKIETVVKNDTDDIIVEKSKPKVLKVKKLNINNKKFDISTQTITEEEENAGSEIYLQALQAFSDKRTDIAIHKLKEYVTNYPNEKLIPKAKYWLGESYLQKEPADYATARYYFLEVVDKHEHHPQNNKQSKALYRLSQLSKINNYDDETQYFAISSLRGGINQ